MTEPVAIVGWSLTPMVRRTDKSEARLLFDVVTGATEDAGITRADVDFSCAGSCDYVAGQAFSFVQNIDAVGAWPPKRDSHVEMDGAWALYEAWVRLQLGDIDVAIAMGSGRSSTADPATIYPMEMDPYYLAPLGADALSFAALQARVLLDAGLITERQLAEIAARARRDARDNPYAQVSGEFDVDALLKEDFVRSPLRRHDLSPITDGAAAVVIARGDKARELTDHPVWITGFAHSAEPHQPGVRDLTTSKSATRAAKAAGADQGPIEVAELQTAFTHEEPLLAAAMGLEGVPVNPSGGPLAANPVMATGLVRVIEAARAIRDHGRQRTLAHSTSGPCLQQNLVCVLEGSR
ncbi:lipid-transfer protein [Cryptosporangium arvum]|uniref:lipid-transfer protein n=1 Tax=Cryptosporangium arvum TaxID=80871 RepID=UPI0004AE2E8F|nr:lipid-transfer protein [Cryptosporangium arvum]